jgi:hypothetical protein
MYFEIPFVQGDALVTAALLIVFVIIFIVLRFLPGM